MVFLLKDTNRKERGKDNMSLIAHYKLDGNALDSSGNGWDGSLINTPNVVAGKIGNAYSFDLATADGISIPDNKFPLYDFTMTAWIKPVGNHYHYDGTIISSGNWNSTHWSFGVNQSNTGFSCRNPYASGAYTFTLNTWHFVVYRREGTNLKLYANNTLVYNNTVATHIPLSSDATNTCIGRETYASGYFGFNGSIDDVRIYDHALSEKEVKELSKAKILHYDFDDFQEPTENILIGGEVPITSSSYGIKDYYFSTPMIDGETYTVSLNGQLGVGKTYFGLYNSGGSVRPVSLYPSDQDVNGTYTKTFTWTVGSSSNTYLRVYHMLSSTVVDSTINWIQLEKKDHATPFTSSTRAGSVSDKSGYDNHAELELATTPQWTEDSKIGSGAYKNNNSTSIFIDTPYGNGINVADVPHTFSMWVYPVDGNSNQMFFSTSNGTNQRIYFAIRSGKWDMGIQGTAWGSGPTPTTINEWSHIVVVMDGSYAKMYVNGVYSFQKPYTSFTAASNFKILSRSDYPFNGSMDDVRIYATALSADDIKELYQTRASIDNKGNLFCGGINEYSNWDKPIINESGIYSVNTFNEVGLPIRYIRDSMVGSSANTGNHWVEIQAFNSRDNNIALGKTAVSSILTDGSTSSSPYYSGGPATVDLGDIYTIMYLKIWHYWADARTYHKIKTEVSADNINWITVFDSDKDGEYVETSEGKEIILYPNKASIRETGEVFVREINEV